MTYYTRYESELIGTLTLASDGESIVGCWFDNDRYFGCGVDGAMEPGHGLAVFEQAREWLDRYFAGQAPNPRELPLGASGTEFQLRVREAMLDIPFGSTTTYGAIAERIAQETGRRQSARAVGGAVGHNPLCLIVPCHRVVGASGSLTGFGGGIDMKVKLLTHEKAMREDFTLPKRGTALAGVPDAASAYFGRQRGPRG
ncbi:MAG: methylated-DNA--[protein]-cysteine S-methyltransferase [Coriobacteriales bacterium]